MRKEKIKVYWIQNDNDYRNNLALHGMMQLSKRKQIDFHYLPESKAADFFDASAVLQHKHRHTSLLVVEQAGVQKRILLDSEDSYAQFCEALFPHVDLYFIAAYNSSIFDERSFFPIYSWQTSEDVQYYRERAMQIISKFGQQFDKIKRFVPIGPNTEPRRKTPFLEQKYYNVRHRLQKWWGGSIYWEQKFQFFEQRYRELAQLRNSNLAYDIVLTDTLWNGWPQHRYNLHQELHRLSTRYDIYANLKRPSGEETILPELVLPMRTKAFVKNYEEMLAASRLAVFAAGFHWGWRNVMTLAFYLGIPVLMDRPMYEPYFDLSYFRFFHNEDTEWKSISHYLKTVDETLWEETKQHNQKIYDQYLLPYQVAEYIIKTALAD